MSKLSLKFLPANILTIIYNYVPDIYEYKCRRCSQLHQIFSYTKY